MRNYTADAVGYLCSHLSQIRARLAGADAADVLARLLGALRDGDDVTSLLDELHKLLQHGGDALGIYGHTAKAPARGPRPDGMGGQRLVQDTVFVCPVGRCTREWSPGSAVAPPHPPDCDVYHKALLWEGRRPWAAS